MGSNADSSNADQQVQHFKKNYLSSKLKKKISVLPELAEELLVCAHDPYGHFQVSSMLVFPFKNK